MTAILGLSRFIDGEAMVKHFAEDSITRQESISSGMTQRDGSEISFTAEHGSRRRASKRVQDAVIAFHKLLHAATDRLSRMFNKEPISKESPISKDFRASLQGALAKTAPLEKLDAESCTFEALKALHETNPGNGPLRSLATLCNLIDKQGGDLLAYGKAPEKLQKAHKAFMDNHEKLTGVLFKRVMPWGTQKTYSDVNETYLNNPAQFRQECGDALSHNFGLVLQLVRDYEQQVWGKQVCDPEVVKQRLLTLEAQKFVPPAKVEQPPVPYRPQGIFSDIPFIDDEPVKASEENRSFASSIPHVRAWRREYLAT